ncbi:hypothetical protein [Jannaschia sp. M317]|nr:hypothetical protein [Jannaschia sp. M317]
MSRKNWLDRTIEAARTETTRMPWSRAYKTLPKPQPVKIRATA